jgi:hypothetical protein
MTKAGNDNTSPESSRDYASPPCLMHLVDPVSGALMAEADAQQRTDIERWRRAERERLIAARLAIPGRNGALVPSALPTGSMQCWATFPAGSSAPTGPFAESRTCACGWKVWLNRAAWAPCRWWCGATRLSRSDAGGEEALEPGVWNIPVPSHGPIVTPDIVIAPVVGFDRACYRLGTAAAF